MLAEGRENGDYARAYSPAMYIAMTRNEVVFRPDFRFCWTSKDEKLRSAESTSKNEISVRL